MNYFYLTALAAAFIYILCWIGGTRLIFSLPAYSVIAIAAVVSIVSAWKKPTRHSAPSFSCLGVTALFFAYILGRAALSPVDYLWWTDFYMVLGCLMVYLLVGFHLTEARHRLAVIWLLLLVAVVEVFIGLKQFTQGDGWMPFGLVRAPYGRRASGMFISPIHFAGFLEAIGVFALSFVFWARWPVWARAVAGYIGVVCLVGIATSGSRGAYLSIVFAIFAFICVGLWIVWRNYRRDFSRAVMFSAIAAILFFGGAVGIMSQSRSLQQRLGLITAQLDSSQRDYRVYNWGAAFDQFLTAPVFGTGAGTHLYYGRQFRRPQLQADPVHAHCDYLELLAEYGIIGAVGMAAFLFTHIRSAFRGMDILLKREHGRRNPERPGALPLLVGSLAAVAAFLAHSVVDFNLHIPANALLFAAIFGMMANPGEETVEEYEPSRWAGIFRWALPALGVTMLALGVPKIPGEHFTEQARLALRDGQYQKAIEIGKKAIEWEKRNPELFFYVGEANRSIAERLNVRASRPPFYEAAVEYYDQGLKIFPYETSLLIRKGQALDGLRRFREAEEAYKRAIELDPSLGVVYAYYAAHLRLRGRLDESDEQLRRAGSLTSQNLAPIMEAVLDAPPSQNEAP